ncbi:MAG: CDP-diacylglycerol--glycerol-3-phosphate 3-phosphatidyltransferase [Clostridia bacterium]|nr:CDP-diacylglycerol--glycerol-3-phosphate 3-phosphatidyltransferase [Clostridia bacterium]
MNLPNKLTCLRMLLVPVLVVVAYLPIEALDTTCGYIPVRYLILLAIFCIASITDYFDGKIARKKNLITTFGKFLDPIADKLLVVASLLVLVEFRMIPAWIVIITEARELLVAASRMLQAKKGNVVAASWYGKVKTVSQMIAIILAFLCVSPFFAFIGGPTTEAFKEGGMIQFVLNILMSIAMCVSLIAAVFSGWDYIKASKDEILESK